MKYCYPEIPKIYWIKYLEYKCNLCKREFQLMISDGNDLVKYLEVGGSGIRWLPTYGKGGYLDLISRLVEGYYTNMEVTMSIAKKFNLILQQYIEPSCTGNTFTLAQTKHVCPICNSKELTLQSETILTNPAIEWLKISCELIK